ncbi:MAG: helix-turn-helix domain-containing protein, partial [Spirochaetota bacterium]|nr:helix-turn-helix domain-containing protein [Spirochaetota bacterium]
MVQNINVRTNSETSNYVLSTTVIKTFNILEYIAANQPVSPPDVAKGLQLPRSSVHRLLATLVSMGYVTKDKSGYYLSFKLFELGNSIPLS